MSRLTRDRSGAPGSVTFDGPVLVLTEGDDDAFVLLAVGEATGISDLQAHVMEGRDTGWGARLKFIVQHPSFRMNARAIGLLRDADRDAAAAFQSCTTALGAAGLRQPANSGEVVQSGGISVGVFIVPGEGDPGAIEDLVLRDAVTERLDCVDAYMTCLREKRLAGPRNSAKGRMQAYLAGLPPSPRTLAVASQQDQFDWNANAFTSLAAWVASLAAILDPASDA